ncbi:hypothetical protein CBC_A1789 [Clostridium botulinum C str. Eklund]|nr:hypothetical protein CBC_A1789 [Clostridium botulinum C str. Eklund]
MNKCIYLKKTEPEVNFVEREHVIPAGIGGINMLEQGMVSDEANTEIFSKLELKFMRNSIISTARSFQGPGKRGSLSDKKATKSNVHLMKKCNSEGSLELGYLERAKPHAISQLKIIYNKEFHIILDAKVSNYNKENEIEKFISKLKKFDGKYKLMIEKELPENYILLGLFNGIWYLASNTKDAKTNDNLLHEVIEKVCNNDLSNLESKYSLGQVQFNIHLEFDMNNDFFRVCAKIAFNTLAFLEGREFVLDKKFDNIREWIVKGGDNKFAQFSASEGQDRFKNLKCILPEHSHSVIISKINNTLVATMNFYGTNFTTLVLLSSNFNDNFEINGLICDWKNRNEYTLLDLISSICRE